MLIVHVSESRRRTTEVEFLKIESKELDRLFLPKSLELNRKLMFETGVKRCTIANMIESDVQNERK